MAGCIGAAVALRWFVGRRIAHIATGEQRRKLFPIEVTLCPGAQLILDAKDIQVKREVHTMPSGFKTFYMVMKPANQTPTHVFVFLHGYSSHADLYMECFAEIVRSGATVLLMDLPGHGRSDGLLTYIPEWWAWVDQIWQFLDVVLPPLRTEDGKQLKVFLSGMSLGGGLTACMAIQRPAFFDGAVLIAPMLFVADEVKPPVIVQNAFRYLLGPFRLSLPVAPAKDMEQFDFRVPEMGAKFTMANPVSMRGCKPRLASALQLAFIFPEWLEANMANMRTPFVIYHGRPDKVTDPNMSQRLYDCASATDKELQLYDGAYHCELICCTPKNAEIIGREFTPEQSQQTEECLKSINQWLLARV